MKLKHHCGPCGRPSVRAVRFFPAAALVLMLAACGAASGSAAAYDGAPDLKLALADRAAEPAPAPAKDASAAKAGQTAKPGSIPANPAEARKRVVTGSIDLQVGDLATAIARLQETLSGLGGYVATSQVEAAWASVVVRIPAERYDDLVKGVSGQGKVIRSHADVADVTDQWFDLDNRLRAKRILLERYLGYLRQAKNVEDLMTVERQVNDVTLEIEQLEGSFKRLANQVAYSTLTVNLSLPGSGERTGYDLGGAMADFLDNAGAFFQGAVVVLLYVLAIGTPLVLLAAAAWWLLFGRIGWIRRLFGVVGRRDGGSREVKPGSGHQGEA